MKSAKQNKETSNPAREGENAARADAITLELAILIVEDEEGTHQPVGMPGSINEARELAQEDLRGRLRRLENDEDPGICPYVYQVWAPSNTFRGEYRIVRIFLAEDLKRTV